jgi:tetratricopeptide (TPR) repeat protein
MPPITTLPEFGITARTPARRSLLFGLLAAALMPGWSAVARAARPGTAPAGAVPGAPLLEGLDAYAFPVASPDALVRRYHQQGMLLVYGFNAAEAARSLEAAVALDPRCAACWWALAWSLGPNINTDMDRGAAERVDQALAMARRHAAGVTPVQRALIDALSRRHPAPGQLDEQAYAQALLALSRREPRDAEVAVLAAEALLNLHPYDWWRPDGRPQPWTLQIEALLRRAMVLQPRHPGAHHYWIHLQESSPHPERARASADALRGAFPGSGHLLHMPSHIDLRTGRFDDAIAANQRSIDADARYLAQVDAQGAYRVGYVAHNHHFLWAAAAMAGQQALALQAAQAAWPAACGPGGRDPGGAIVQHYAVLPYFTLVRFGQWQALLRDTLPPDTNAAYPQAIWHYARGTALARTGQLDAARRELAALERIAADPSLQGLRLKNINAAAQVTRMAVLTLQAELAWVGGAPGSAAQLLRQTTAVEDTLEYDEPHLWLAPTRHALGAALLAAGQAAQAEQVFRQDLRHYPGNGWSLNGLAQALSAQGKQPQAAQAAVQARAAFGPGAQLPATSRF